MVANLCFYSIHLMILFLSTLVFNLFCRAFCLFIQDYCIDPNFDLNHFVDYLFHCFRYL